MINLKIKVVPESSKNKVIQNKDGEYEVKLKAKTERNQANESLKLVLAEYFQVDPAAVKIVSGHHSRHKRLTINT